MGMTTYTRINTNMLDIVDLNEQSLVNYPEPITSSDINTLIDFWIGRVKTTKARRFWTL